MNTLLIFIIGGSVGFIFGLSVMFWLAMAIPEDTAKRRR